MTRAPIIPRWFLLFSALALLAWQIALFLCHFSLGTGPYLARLFYTTQDMPVIIAGILALTLLSAVPWYVRGGEVTLPPPRVVWAAVAIFALVAWAGHYLVFADYALTRDEEMAEFAGYYLARGMLGVPIPPEWADYARPMVPIFFSSFGAEHVWSSAYLPVGSAIRAALLWLGDDDLSGPLLTAAGLLALWRGAVRIFPERADAVWVALLMALSSSQLLTMAMTPYAATQHFGLDMLWLALVLRGRWLDHALAALVALAAMGLHQWHFLPLFVGPFLLWFLLQRRWGVAAFHTAVLAIGVLLWVRGWPMVLEVVNGVAPPSAPPPRVSISEKIIRLFSRLDAMEPLFSLARLTAWNNILLLPLAGLAVPVLWQRWRETLRGKEIVLPLLLVVLTGMGLMLYQKHGWGYRYMHAAIGPLCLLAGFGWVRLSGTPRRVSLRMVGMTCALAGIASVLLLAQAHRFVMPYARAQAAIRESWADVVLVDTRGGLYAQDLVRMERAEPADPAVMDLSWLTRAGVDRLCATHSVALFDQSDFAPMGVPRTRFSAAAKDHNQALVTHMRETGCLR